MAKRKYFGTDGVRDVANTGMMTIEFAMKLGQAYGMFILDKEKSIKTKIIIGRDTRISGTMIQSALAAGINSVGIDVVDTGVIPTPGVSYILAHSDFDGGAVISASHNPWEYNGIKFLDKNGFKLTDEDEVEIEANLLRSNQEFKENVSEIGCTSVLYKYSESYLNSLKELFSLIATTKKKIVVDSANGAASDFVEKIYGVLDSDVTLIDKSPNGKNINNGCGVTHMENLVTHVVNNGADLGIAYDGDADRILMCDSQGRVIDGDIMLWVISRWMDKNNKLGSGVVTTVMSNMVLDDLLTAAGIDVFRCGVGDRYVLDKMRETGARLGGEQSGHIIALDHANTGDGISSGILFLRAVEELGENLATLVDRFVRYPQLLTNIRVKDKQTVLNSHVLVEAEQKAEKMLTGEGRMLLRPSGTEPLIRVLVESRDYELMNKVSEYLCNVIREIEGII